MMDDNGSYSDTDKVKNEDTRTTWEKFQDRAFIFVLVIFVLVVVGFVILLISGDTITNILEAAEEGQFWQSVGNQ